MSESEAKISRRKYLKYVGGAAAAAIAAGAGYYALQPSPAPPTPTTTFAASTTAATHEQVTLNVMTIAGARFETPLRALLPSFQERYPWINVNISALGLGEVMAEKGPMELSSRRGAYDALIIDAGFTAVYAEAGWTTDLTDYLLSTDREVGILDFEQDFPENVRFWTMQDVVTTSEKYKRYFAITADCNSFLNIFRTDIFNKLGLGYNDIKTFPDALAVEEKIQKSGDYGFAASMRASIWSACNFESLLWSAGGQVWNEETFRPELDTPEAKAALEWLAKEMRYAVPGILTWADPEVDESYMRGEAVFMPHEWANPTLTDPNFNKFADVTDCTQQVPEWPNSTRKPLRVTKQGVAPCIGGLPYAIDSASKHPFETYLLVRWLVLKENAKTYVDNTGQIGRLSVLNDPEIQKEHPIFKGLAVNLPLAVARSGVPEYSDLETIIGRDVNSYVVGELSLDAALKDMQSECTDILKKSGRYTGSTLGEPLSVSRQIKYILNRAERYRALRLAGLVNPNSPHIPAGFV